MGAMAAPEWGLLPKRALGTLLGLAVTGAKCGHWVVAGVVAAILWTGICGPGQDALEEKDDTL